MEIVVAQIVAGVFLLSGTIITVLHQSKQTQLNSTKQHEEQTKYLKSIVGKQDVLADQVSSIEKTNEILFSMVVELDQKVTKPQYKRKAVSQDAV
jgi:hypothetical protein